MKTRINSTLALAASIAVAAGFNATAQADNYKGLDVSGMFSAYVYDSNRDLDNTVMPSLKSAYHFGNGVALEASVGYLLESAPENTATTGKFGGYNYHLDLLAHTVEMAPQTLIPYVAIGIGEVNLDPDTGRNLRDTAVNLGGGMKYFLNDSLALRADARLYHTIENSDATDFSIGAGFNYLFGGLTVTPDIIDSDGDGVLDDTDRCPNTPAGTVVDTNGCALDSDNDGVVDAKDQCPSTPAGAPVDTKGCPLDSDNDGIADYQDKCPATPTGAKIDASGCAVVLNKKVSIALEVKFANNKAAFVGSESGEIAKVAAFMREYPNTNTTIEGYTDSRGSDSYNQQLSQKRADAVMKALVDGGISASRLTAIGYGEANPIADNASAERRAQNRRVTAVVVGTSAK